jgi:hypothetical protein
VMALRPKWLPVAAPKSAVAVVCGPTPSIGMLKTASRCDTSASPGAATVLTTMRGTVPPPSTLER